MYEMVIYGLGQAVLCFMCYKKGRYDSVKLTVDAYVAGMQLGAKAATDYYHQQQQPQPDTENTKDD